MDRHRGDRFSGNHDGGRGGRHHNSRMSSRSSSGHHDYPNQRQPFSRGGGGGGGGPSGGHRYPPNNFPMHHSGGGGCGGRSGGGGGNMRQGSGYGGSPQPPYLSGHKRPSSGFSSPGGGGGGFFRRGSSPDSTDTGTFAKLFVGSVPRTAREEEIRPLFEEHGNVLEVALIKDKRTGQQQGCCFVKYATSEEADRAVRALHNQCTLPGGLGPIQVRYADGERERLGAAEYKLFVGSLNKEATEKEIEEIFSPYGRVEDVYIMRDDLKQSRGCGFVKFSYRDMAAAAIDALNGKYIMRGCDQPLTVRFADPKRPKTGDSRSGPAFGGPGFGQRSQLPPMNRSGYYYPIPTPKAGGNMGIRMPLNSWHPMSPENFGMHSSQVNSNVIGGHPGVRGGAGTASPAAAGAMGLGVLGAGGPPNGSLVGPAVAPIPSSQQGLNMPLMQAQPFGQPLSPSKKSLPSPQHLPSSLQHQQQTLSYAQGQTPLTSVQFSHQLQTPLLMNQQAFGQRPPPQHLFSLNNQLSSSQPQIHQMTSALQPIPSSSQLQSGVSVPHAQLALVANQTPQLQVQPSPGHQQQLMLQQQAQASQSSLQSPQHAYSQLQQQLHMVQSTSQNQSQPMSQPHKQQTSWVDVVPQTVASTPATTAVIVSSSAMVPVIPVSSKTEAPVHCNWTEHTSPEGYKYYYNSVTRESRWEKPEELIAFEQKQQPQQQQQQMPPSQHLQAQSQAQLQSQLQSPQQVSQSQQQQPPAQGQQLQVQHQQPGLSSLYQTTGVLGSQNIQGLSYMQLQGAGSTIDPSRLQQAVAAQEWMWKNKATGN